MNYKTKLYLYLIPIFLFLIYNGCKKSYEPIEIEKELPLGYQHDIPWPSLADSPWPMNHGDPQSTGRSKHQGPTNGILERIFETPEIASGIVFDADSTIYCSTLEWYLSKNGLYAFDLNGKRKWKFSNHLSYSTPLIGNDGTIYYPCSLKFYAVNPDSTLKWEYIYDDLMNITGINIGLDGTLYFIDFSNKLTALGSDGKVKWTMTSDKFNANPGNSLAFSPDGNTLYTVGREDALLAIDVNTQTIKWVFGKHNNILNMPPPVVDSQGNIYIKAIIDSINSGNPSFFSIYEDGNIRWVYNLNTNFYYQPTIDKNGNIYFGGDSLIAVDYFGNLRWKRSLDYFIDTDLICDINSVVYVGLGSPTLRVIAIDRDNNIIWELNESVVGFLSGSPALGYQRLFIPTSNTYNFYSIK